VIQPVAEKQAVGQFGQRVVVRQEIQPPLGFLDRRNIGHDRDVVRQGAVGVTDFADGLQQGQHAAVPRAVDDLAMPVPVWRSVRHSSLLKGDSSRPD